MLAMLFRNNVLLSKRAALLTRTTPKALVSSLTHSLISNLNEQPNDRILQKEDLVSNPDLVGDFAMTDLSDCVNIDHTSEKTFKRSIEDLRLIAYAKVEILKRYVKEGLVDLNNCIGLVYESKLSYQTILKKARQSSKEWHEALSCLKELRDFTKQIAPKGNLEYQRLIANMTDLVNKCEHLRDEPSYSLR